MKSKLALEQQRFQSGLRVIYDITVRAEENGNICFVRWSVGYSECSGQWNHCYSLYTKGEEIALKFLLVDDEPFALEELKEALHEAAPDGKIVSFLKPGEALEYARANAVDVTFLDIELGSMNGILTM